MITPRAGIGKEVVQALEQTLLDKNERGSRSKVINRIVKKRTPLIDMSSNRNGSTGSLRGDTGGGTRDVSIAVLGEGATGKSGTFQYFFFAYVDHG